jgi:monoamine oxidase
MDCDVVILGGGVAGLAAAGAVARRGLTVVLVEARDRLGGRILTLEPQGWPVPVELGAEFVHGGNPALWRLLRRHRIGTQLVPHRHWLSRAPHLQPIDDLAERIAHVTDRIEARRMKHWSFARFMREKGEGFSASDRELATGFVEGFQAAPQNRMSAAALKGETLEDDDQFRVPRGYARVVDALVRDLPAGKVRIVLNSTVSRVSWAKGKVRVLAGRSEITARAAIVTLPLGVLQARPTQRGAVRFDPPLIRHAKAAGKIGLGHVVRVSLRFDAHKLQAVLPTTLRRVRRAGFGFIHSHGPGVPVWWSLTGAAVLTGWAGGPAALRLSRASRSEILQRALRSLARILGRQPAELQRALSGWETHNWTADPFSRGAYSFIAAGGETAAEALRQPLRQTLFFAGEATADGEEVGTVHGALGSGLRAAEEAANALKRAPTRSKK